MTIVSFTANKIQLGFQIVYSYNPPRSSSTDIFSFSSLAFSDALISLNPGRKNHSEVSSNTQIKLTIQCIMDWQGRKNDEGKLSLCSQIPSNIITLIIILMMSPMLVLLDDQTRSDLSCLSASEENISVNAHFRLFPWKIHKLI